MNNLWVIMPVYNEQECVANVIEEWRQELAKYSFTYTFCILNDGSKDSTLNILKEIEGKDKNIKVVDKPNSGHGQTCVEGYRIALKNNAEWIFQIDSDGQCDTKYFSDLIKEAEDNKVVYGYRKSRDDGFQRFLVSRIVTWFVFFATKVWVRDANVPYRLMHKDALKDIVGKVPSDFYLANILVSVFQKKYFGIKWINIHFRQRMGGVASVKTFSFAKHGLKLFKQLKQIINL